MFAISWPKNHPRNRAMRGKPKSRKNSKKNPAGKDRLCVGKVAQQTGCCVRRDARR